jgi:uncharacterized protein YjaZ
MPINKYIANASNEFGIEILRKIEEGFREGLKIIRNKLNADKIDIIFVNAPMNVIPEIGIGGYSPGPYNIYVSLDPKFTTFTVEDMTSTILHETHHCMRWRNPGYGLSLGEAMISEGLATLFEEEYSGITPLYAQVKIKQEEIEKANKSLNNKEYNHSDWFFGGKDTQRWFAYTYGYKISKSYSQKVSKTAAELVNTPAKLFFDSKI